MADAARAVSLAAGESEAPVHLLRRCPKCGAVTERTAHCHIKGPPLFPQMGSDTSTVPCEVVEREPFVAALAYMRGKGLIGDRAYRRVLGLITPFESEE